MPNNDFYNWLASNRSNYGINDSPSVFTGGDWAQMPLSEQTSALSDYDKYVARKVASANIPSSVTVTPLHDEVLTTPEQVRAAINRDAITDSAALAAIAASKEREQKYYTPQIVKPVVPTSTPPSTEKPAVSTDKPTKKYTVNDLTGKAPSTTVPTPEQQKILEEARTGVESDNVPNTQSNGLVTTEPGIEIPLTSEERRIPDTAREVSEGSTVSPADLYGGVPKSTLRKSIEDRFKYMFDTVAENEKDARNNVVLGNVRRALQSKYPALEITDAMVREAAGSPESDTARRVNGDFSKGAMESFIPTPKKPLPDISVLTPTSNTSVAQSTAEAVDAMDGLYSPNGEYYDSNKSTGDPFIDWVNSPESNNASRGSTLSKVENWTRRNLGGLNFTDIRAIGDGLNLANLARVLSNSTKVGKGLEKAATSIAPIDKMTSASSNISRINNLMTRSMTKTSKPAKEVFEFIVQKNSKLFENNPTMQRYAKEYSRLLDKGYSPEWITMHMKKAFNPNV